MNDTVVGLLLLCRQSIAKSISMNIFVKATGLLICFLILILYLTSFDMRKWKINIGLYRASSTSGFKIKSIIKQDGTHDTV